MEQINFYRAWELFWPKHSTYGEIRSARNDCMADRMTEEEFVAQYDGYAPRRVARDLYRAMYPTGMHTNGPTRVVVEASLLTHILQKWRAHSASGEGHE